MHAFEVGINLLVLFDTLMRGKLLGCHVLDVLMIMLCVAAIAASWMWHENSHMLQGASNEVLVAVICVAQYARILTLVKSTTEKHAVIFACYNLCRPKKCM